MMETAKVIEVKKGTLRSQAVSGRYMMVRPFSEGGNKGSFVTVKLHNGQVARLYCAKKDFAVVGASTEEEPTGVLETMVEEVDFEQMVRSTETSEQAATRIKKSFEIITTMTRGAIKGMIRGLVVSGPPGIGKSFSVEETIVNNLPEENYEIVKGKSSAICLYQTLYHNRGRHNVVVFDDCDSVLHDDEALNILKAVLDSSERRFVSWNSESFTLAKNDIPNKFEFHGSVIFLTNLNFDKNTQKRLQPHLDALKSRCFYLDLGISNQSDMLIRITSLVGEGMLNKFDLTDSQTADVVNFITSHVSDLQELSLRTVVKVAGLRKTGGDWMELAIHSVLKPAAKWKSLMAARAA
jgi:hypothetical protein